MIWFTSDTHFDHEKMVGIRGFSSVDEMNESIIQMWNSLVSKRDVVYHLGDFSFGRDPSQHFNRLNGEKHLIEGNHDGGKIRRLGWSSVSPMKTLKHNRRSYVLLHYPMLTWANPETSIHLHGHCHGNLKNDQPRRMDVGIDAIPGLGMVSIDDLEPLFRFEYKKVDHH